MNKKYNRDTTQNFIKKNINPFILLYRSNAYPHEQYTPEA